MVLLTPGPVMTSEKVRLAAASPDMNHREPQFRNLVRECRRMLLDVHPETREGWHPYIIGGSGTAAVEAMVASCVEKGPVLVVENGYYSRRIREILEVYGIPYEPFELGWEERWTPVHLGELGLKLMTGGFEAMIATHHETTLGRLNPIGDMGEVCRKTGTRLLVDAMSSFGGDPIDFDCVDAIASSANKCLHSQPGVSFVLVQDRLAARIGSFPRRSFYLSLPMYAGEQPPLTPPVPAMQAFRQALRENPGGHTARHRLYQERLRLLRDGLAARGFGFAVPENEASCTLLAATIPEGWTYERWFDANYEAGFVIYGCKEHLHERYFQVSVMGELTDENLRSWLDAVDRILAA